MSILSVSSQVVQCRDIPTFRSRSQVGYIGLELLVETVEFGQECPVLRAPFVSYSVKPPTPYPPPTLTETRPYSR